MDDNTANNTEIKRLLQKFLRNECSPTETDKVIAYFQDARQTDAFPQVEDVLATLDELPKVNQQVSDHILTNILSESKHRQITRGKIWKYASIAAMFIGLIGLGIYFEIGSSHIQNDLVVPGNDVITLEMDNGEVKVLDEGASTAIANASGQVVGQQEKTKLTYSAEENRGVLVYNTLRAPYGKRFNLELSDGS